MKNKKTYIWFMLPGLFFYCIFMIFPLISSGILSFTSWDGIGSISFVGLKNYMTLLRDPANFATYKNAITNNLQFILSEYLISVPLQLLVAYLFYSKIRWYKFFQASMFLPYVLSTPVIAFFVTIMFNPTFGMINKFLLKIGVSRAALPGWFANQKMMFPLLFAVSIWYSASIGMLIILASMKNVSHDTIEAAMIDGANSWQRFFHIVLADIGPAMINVLVLDIIWGITLFDLPYMIAGTFGGVGGELDFANMYFYRVAFGSGVQSRLEIDFGYAATVGTVTFLIILLFTSLMSKLLSRVKVWNE